MALPISHPLGHHLLLHLPHVVARDRVEDDQLLWHLLSGHSGCLEVSTHIGQRQLRNAWNQDDNGAAPLTGEFVEHGNRGGICVPELFLAVGLWEPPVGWAPWWPENDNEAEISGWVRQEPLATGEAFNRSMLGEERWEALPQRTQDLLRAEGVSFRADLQSQLEFPFDAADLKTPLVVGCGTESPPSMTEGCRRLTEISSGQYWLIDGANHVAHTDHPEIWAELVRRTVALAR
jgi:pimeloyl-ACP methyl ester carboxylesterase